MSGGKFTPGPWQHYADLPSADPNWHIVTNANRMRVVANVHIEPGNATDEANARLIVAAPELLTSLKEMKELFRFALMLSKDVETAKEGMEFVGKAEAIIAKAEDPFP